MDRVHQIINKYPDGSSYAEIGPDFGSIITHRVNSYEDLWHLNQIVDAYYNRNNRKPTVIIPNLIDAQADRRFANNQSSGLKLVCKFLNSMPANFKVFHPHNPEVVEALMDNVEIIDNTDYIEKVLNYISGNYWKGDYQKMEGNLILMSSDAGGFKPLMKLCDKIDWQGETYSASKYRANYGSDMKLYQEIDRQDFGGKDILIVDDICVYGGTFKGLANLLKDRNCGKLYLAVSHMTVQNLEEEPVTNYFDKVFTTNSKFDRYVSRWTTVGNEYETVPTNLEIIKLFAYSYLTII